MAYNKENYRRIRAAYQTKYLKAREEADRRMAELHEKSPAVAAIDRELALTGAEIAMAAIGTGADYREKLAAVEQKNLALQRERAILLEKLGYPADYTLPPYECEICRDSGFVALVCVNTKYRTTLGGSVNVDETHVCNFKVGRI